MADALVRRSATGASLLMGMVALQRVATFALNTLVTRAVGPEVLGFAAGDMELLLASLLFLSREPFRLAALRIQSPTTAAVGADKDLDSHEDVARRRQTLLNLAWGPVALGLPLAALGAIASWWLNIDDAKRLSAVLFCAGAALETLAEPGYILAQHRLRFDIRVLAEGVGVMLRCVCVYVLVTWAGLGVVAFGAAQTLYGAAVVLVYWSWLVCAPRSSDSVDDASDRAVFLMPHGPVLDRLWALAPGTLPTIATAEPRSSSLSSSSLVSSILPPHSTSLLGSFAAQGVVKHLLTEGNRLILQTTSSAIKGEFAVVTSYGSLAVRLLLQPVEDAGRTMFAKASRADAGLTVATAGSSPPATSGVTATSSHSTDRRSVLMLLALTLRLVVTLGLVIACLGPAYTEVGVWLLLGPRWASSGVPRALAAYCLYIFALAANGVTEAFVHAVGTDAQIQAQNRGLVIISVVYVALAVGDPTGVTGLGPGLLARWGLVGLIAADAMNMALRVVLSLGFLQDYAAIAGSQRWWVDVLPSPQVLVALAISASVTQWSASAVTSWPVHCGIGVGAAAVVLSALVIWDRVSLLQAWRTLRAPHTASDGTPSKAKLD